VVVIKRYEVEVKRCGGRGFVGIMRMEWAVSGSGDDSDSGSGVTAKERSMVAGCMLSDIRVVSISLIDGERFSSDFIYSDLSYGNGNSNQYHASIPFWNGPSGLKRIFRTLY
jgi:hypothetical protein